MGVDWKKKIAYPVWLPPSLKANYEELRGASTLESYRIHSSELGRAWERLLTRHEMEEVWEHFHKHRKSDKIVEFATYVTIFYSDALERHQVGGQKKETTRNRSLKEKIQNQIDKLRGTIRGADQFDDSLKRTSLKGLDDIRTALVERLDFLRDPLPSMLWTFGPALRIVATTPNVGAKGFVKTFLMKVIAELFKVYFGSPNAALVSTVTYVLLGEKVPSDRELRREEVFSSKRPARHKKKLEK